MNLERVVSVASFNLELSLKMKNEELRRLRPMMADCN